MSDKYLRRYLSETKLIKVAVCLRGQPRFSQEGAFLFQKLVMEHHPDVEFKFFVHSWNTMSRRMMGTEDDDKTTERLLPVFLTYEEVHDMIAPWNPTKFLIETEADNLQLACDIESRNVKYEKITYDWFQEYLELQGWNQQDARFDNHKLLMPASLDISKVFSAADILKSDSLNTELLALVKINRIQSSYLYGQMFSAGKSFRLLQDYIEETDYHPDIVINTRHDVIAWFHHFPKLLYEIKKATVAGGFPIIYSKEVAISNSKPIVDDYMFIGNLISFLPFLADIRSRMFNTFTSGSFSMFDLFNSGSLLQHQLWSKIPDPNLHFVQPSIGHWNDQVIRPGHDDFTQIKIFDRSTYDKLSEKTLQYTYPDNPKQMLPDEIFLLYSKMMERF